MTIIKSNHAGLGGAGAPGGALASFYSHTIDQSLRFNDNDSAVLTFTPSSAGDRETWTWSAWVKRSNLGGNATLFCSAAGDYNLKFHTDNKIKFEGAHGEINTAAVFRDVSTWYHIVTIHDTTEGTASNRFKIYVNGVLQTTSGTYPSGDGVINSTTSHGLGGQTSANFFDGYMAEVHFIDGTAVAPTSFGETKDGVWIPKAYSGSHGSQGWYLPFDDSSAIGDDESANTNDWTANNLAASDVVPDSPTKNFATMNPLMIGDARVNSSAAYSEGNLKVAGGGFTSSSVGGGYSTIAIPKDKKIYMEVCETDTTGDLWSAGILIDNHAMNSTTIGGNGSIAYYNRSVYVNGSETDYGASAGIGGLGVAKLVAGDVLGIAVDGATGKVWFHRNGTYFKSPSTNDSGTTGNPSAGTNEIGTIVNTSAINPSGEIFFYIGNHGSSDNCVVNFGQDSTFAGSKTAGSETDANGEGLFQYAVPTDYVCLHSGNMSDPAIGPGQSSQADDHFNVIAYTGNGSTQSITGVGFEPDLVWIKNITSSYPNVLTDSVRGVTKEIQSESSTATESTNADGLTAFDADGFSLGDDDYYNYNSNSFISFSWKAATTASGTESGSNPAYSSSSNSTAGVSIVAYTGTGSTGTVSHGAGVVPKMILIKNRDVGDNWAVYHAGTASDPETDYLILNTNAAAADSANWWNDTAPTSSVFTVATDHSVNADGEKYIAYVFAPIEGYSAFGAYEGNGSADGAFVYTGFSPKWLLTKSVDSTSNWHIHDVVRHSENPNDAFSYADTVNIGAGAGTDFLSNGFKHRQSSDSNVAETYVYAAFAEAPFKYANAR